MEPTILIVEDEAPQAEMLRYNLEREGFRITIAQTGEEAVARAELDVPDLVVVDWMLPERSGIDVCRRLRARAETKRLPIIMLTARGEESDRILGLDVGADDYIVKPYSPREMVARVKALLRRTDPRAEGSGLEHGAIVMDLEAHKVTREGVLVHLGPTGFRLLRALMEKPGRVYSREALLARAWGGDINVEPRTVDVHIRRLRMALNAHGGRDLIRTVRGAGYALDEQKD
ncbi:MAG: phosphate regulon transcriptional regulator PhoB [Kiloniellaceae bacterium]